MPSSDSFVHLHVHSEYSLLDGACRVDALCRRSAEDGSPAVALTDHGVMFGAMEFYYAAREVSLTPIVGCEAYIAPRGRFDRTVRDEAHVTLLAADLVGYRNLVALISKGFLEGYYYKPRIDLDLLAKHNDGLIVLSGCMSGLCAAPLLKNDYASSVKAATTFREIFGDRFYMEIMRHGMPEEDVVNKGLIKVARELNIPLVATNDSHYLRREDATSHDVLLCIGTGKMVQDQARMKFASDEFYVKSAVEMRELFADVPDACDNTIEIAKRIDIKIPEKVFYLPDYPVPRRPEDDAAHIIDAFPEAKQQGLSAEEYLRAVCERGLVERYGEERVQSDAALRERLDYELDVITSMGFASYFLIVWDFIKFARDRGIPVGPGRGSAVGSLVSYALKITALDPIKFDLIFERFLNPERISMPDIDTDFCVERRDEVIEYVTEKYGKDHVAQIVTFGTMAARAAVRDAGRALGVPLPDVDRVAKLIPSGPGGLSIEKALEQIPELRALYDNNPPIRKLLETASSIEGLARHASTHAAGVVISKGPLVEHVPLVRIGDGDVNTQYDMNMVEKIGLLKMDFLGLRNLTVMKNAVDEIRRTTDPQFDIDRIPDDDPKTFEMLGRGETTGVFQLESDGMRRVCTELKPSSLDDIIALVALYRPGPMDWIPAYIASKHGRKTPTYLHPKLEPILRETYGIACLRAGTPVWYVDGTMKPIESVQPGDEILTFDKGEVRAGRAAKVWPSGKKRLLRITLSTGTVIECSEDHRFPTPIGDLFARDLRPNLGYKKRKSYAYGQPESILFEAWEPPRESRSDFSLGGEDRAWLLGMLVGDGSLKTHGSVQLTCGSREDADALATVFESAFNCRTTVWHNTRAWHVRPAFDTTPKPTPLTLWLDEAYSGRSWKVTCREKHLPERFRDLGEHERVALLRGLWDSDGTYAGTGQYFRSTSSRLVAQVADLLASLKIAYYVRDTAVFIQDRTRFTAILGGPRLPKKSVAHHRERNVMPVLTGALRSRIGSLRLSADHLARQSLQNATSGALTKVNAASDWCARIPSLWKAHAASYEELYLGATRPVFIDAIEYAGEDECFDLQMTDQSAPYFLANGTVTHNCYQEQIMQIARDLAGFTMGQADELRKVMGKKQKDKVPIYREKFIRGCAETNQIPQERAEQIFAFIEPFAGYGFNKSHAAAYGWISYQTAYLKANHPVAYFAALMTSVKDKTDKLVEYVDEAKKLGVEVLPPDVNASRVDFTVVGTQIRFGLAAVKGVGENAVRAVLDARESGGPFTDLFDLVRRVDLRAVNRKVYESLIKCGALDGLPGNRAQLLDGLDLALDVAAHETRERELGQVSLFGSVEEHAPALAPALRYVAPPSTMEQLAWEKETLGIFVSGHPLADVADALARVGATPVRDLRSLEDDSPVTIAGLVTAVRRTLTKSQAQMLFATIEDTSGSVETIVFPKSYDGLQSHFVEDAIVIVKGRLRHRERPGAKAGEEPPLELTVAVSEVQKFERRSAAPPRRANGWHVTVTSREQIDDLALLLSEWPGTTPLVLHLGEATLQRAVAADARVRERLVAIAGESAVREGAP